MRGMGRPGSQCRSPSRGSSPTGRANSAGAAPLKLCAHYRAGNCPTGKNCPLSHDMEAHIAQRCRAAAAEAIRAQSAGPDKSVAAAKPKAKSKARPKRQGKGG
eukprot:4272062-Alexandrium_andersonii.AAC.1